MEQYKTTFDLQDVSIYYGNFKAIHDLRMQIEGQKVTAFIGPSGCGKSTVLKTLNRMNDLLPNARVDGTILLDGEDIFKDIDAIDLRTRVGMVFQQPNPFPMTIYDNVSYGPRVQRTQNKAILDEIVENSLKAAALWDEVKDKLNQSALGLSGGQQQRLCIARTLAIKPEVILMDEPTSALDPISTSKIEELIDQLREDYTIIIVTHNMQQAGRISDKTAFFYNGKLIEFADTDAIFTNPSEEKTEEYITGRFS